MVPPQCFWMPRRRVCNRVCLLQGLFYRVISGDVTPFRLVRLSAEELLSKEMSEWRKPDAPDVNAAQTKRQELAARRTVGNFYGVWLFLAGAWVQLQGSFWTVQTEQQAFWHTQHGCG